MEKRHIGGRVSLCCAHSPKGVMSDGDRATRLRGAGVRKACPHRLDSGNEHGRCADAAMEAACEFFLRSPKTAQRVNGGAWSSRICTWVDLVAHAAADRTNYQHVMYAALSAWTNEAARGREKHKAALSVQGDCHRRVLDWIANEG